MGFGDVSGSGEIWVEADACLICDDGQVRVRWNFVQGSPCFRPWPLLRLVHFVVFRGLSGSGGIWDEVEA